MRLNRTLVLFVLACLTVCFLGAAYALWFNPTGLPLVGSGGLPTPAVAATIGTIGDSITVQITITDSGVAAITEEQLRSTGLSFTNFSSDELSLTRHGQPVPFWIKQVGEQTLLLFYAQSETNPNEPLAVYEIRPGAGQRMNVRSAQPFNEGEPQGKHVLNWEEDRFFVERATRGDAWMGPLLLAPDRWTLHLDGIQPDGNAAALTVDLFTPVETDSEQQHHVELQVNDVMVANHYWSGAGQKVISVPLEAGLLGPDRANYVTVIVHADSAPPGEAIYIDSVELAYEGLIDVSEQAVTFSSDAPNIRIEGAGDELIVLDISDPYEPVALIDIRSDGSSVHFAGGSIDTTLIALNPASTINPNLKTVPIWESSLYDTSRGADYLAIVADMRGFEEALEPLLVHRQNQGLRIAAVPLQQVFDEFSYGHEDPDAITEFIAYATGNWSPPAPRYVLLVGDATYDITDQVPGKNRNLLPTKVVYTSRGGHVASDVSLLGSIDSAPQVAIGRFPAQNAPQLSAMVNKTIAYEQELADEDNSWKDEVLLVADDEPAYDETIEILEDYLGDDGYSVYSLHMSHNENIRHRIVSAINQGVGLISYIGQGSEDSWGDEAVFRTSDAQALYNSPRLPILNTFTCRSGSFANPQIDSLAESLLRVSNGGIIASVAPSGHLAEEQYQPLTILFHEQLILDEPSRLGDKLLNMYETMVDDPSLREAMIPINLLGDPALQIESGSDANND